MSYFVMNNNTNAVNAPIHPGPWQSLQQNSAEYSGESDTTTDDLSDDDISYDALRNEMFLEEYFRQQSLRMQAIYPPSFKSKINSKFPNNKNSHTKGSRSINEGTTKSYAIEQPRNSSKYHRQRNSSLHGSDKVRSTTRKGELSDIILGSLEKLGIIRSDRRKSIS